MGDKKVLGIRNSNNWKIRKEKATKQRKMEKKMVNSRCDDEYVEIVVGRLGSHKCISIGWYHYVHLI